MKKPPVKSVLLASLAAVLLALAQPSLIALTIVICIAPVVIAVLHAWAGWIPAAIASVGTVSAVSYTAALTGAVNPLLAGLGALVVLVAPGIVSIALLEKRAPFFRRLFITAAAQLAALLGGVSFIYLGMKLDLATLLIQMLRNAVMYMPEDMVIAYLNMFAMQGVLTEESIALLTGESIQWADVMTVFEQAFEVMEYQFRLTLPALLINSGLISGILTVMLPGTICVRRGDEPQVDHVPLHEWFMSSRVVGGVAVCMLTGIILQYMKIDGSIGVTAVFSTLASTLCIIQGMAAVSRKFREAGAGRGARIGLIVAALLFASTFLELVGMASALFGRKGAISTWMRKRMEDMENDRKDDDDE